MTLDLLIIGLGIAVDPLPLTTFILVLTSKRGVRKGAAFIFGWLASLAAVIAVTVLATGNNPPKAHSFPSDAALVVKLLIGLALIVIAVRRYRAMGKPKKPKKTPKWQTGIDDMSLWFALALAPVTQPWGLIAAGVTVIVQANISSAESMFALIMFCIVGSSTYIGLEVFLGFWPERANDVIVRTRGWITAHADQAIVIGSLALGFYLVGSAIYHLFS